MAGFKGRKIKFYWGGDPPMEEIAGVREKSVTCNGEPVDVTADDSSNWRELLTDESAQDQVDISISGVTKDAKLKEDWFNGNRSQAFSIVYPDGGELAGTGYLMSYADTGPYNDATTFEAEIQSTGPVTYTPAT